ncbi:MAG: ABC transporter ATP-binding protein [Clostridiales bacterium]
MSKAVIRLADVCKTYDTGAIQVQALKHVDLVINEGEFVAIMGQSGSGKSTLMNILGCLDRPTSGKFYLGEDDVSVMEPKELATVRNKKIGFVFQSFNLIPRTTALKNVELPMVYARQPKTERRRRAEELLARVGLADRGDHLPNELSGGQKQRVAIARALVNQPQMLLADEPTGNLDTASSLEIMELFCALNGEGVTVVVVTHEEEIASYCGRVVRFKDGQLISDLLQEPARPAAGLAGHKGGSDL